MTRTTWRTRQRGWSVWEKVLSANLIKLELQNSEVLSVEAKASVAGLRG